MNETTILDYKEEELLNALSPAHAAFCQKYAALQGNGTKAYQSVYIEASYETARVNASRLLTNANIKAYIALLTEKTTIRNQIDIDDIVRRHLVIINADPFKYFEETVTQTEHGSFRSLTLKPLEEIPEEERWLVHKMRSSKNGDSLDLLDKHKSLDTLAKIAGLYSDKEVLPEKNAKEMDVEITLEEIRKRIDC